MFLLSLRQYTVVNVSVLGESDQCAGFSGADLASLVREACVAALRAGMVGLGPGGTSRGKAVQVDIRLTLG